jgi:hypothetical protein
LRYCISALIGGLLLAGCTTDKTVESMEREPARVEAPKPPEVITTATLLDELVDLRRLAELPVPAYQTIQHSSYDRASKTPEDYDGWFANGDRGQFIRIEERDGRKEGVMMEADGPGAIVRIWSANPNDGGTIRIYIDGAEKPVIETSMQGLLGGEYPGLPQPIAGMRARGWNLYFPIPYAKHCKVTGEGNFYYHVNFRKYAPGTAVESFTAEDITRLEGKIKEVAERLTNVRVGGGPPADRVRKPFEATLSGGKEVTLATLEGEKAICGLLFHITASDLPAAARATVLRISFDGKTTVECPLGDFYGSAALVPYESLPLGITDRKPSDLWCHWWMPFRKNAKISVRNLGSQTVQINGAVATVPYEWTDNTLYFHAKWRIERDLPARPFTDWAHLEAKGAGRFVGGTLHIINNLREWWGEGDEKIYVDGEKFPSHFGTGTEDYYGYAWCSPERFVHAYHNQPACQGPGIPFTKSFKFDIENWHGTDRSTARTTRAAASFWYAREGGSDFFKPITPEDVRFDTVPEYAVPIVKGAIEGEGMKVLEKTAIVERQDLGDSYSRGAHLWWREGAPGDKLVLSFNAPRAGRQRVIAKLTKAYDYGIHQLSINGQKAGEPLDFYSQGLTQVEVDLGEFDLKEGENTLTVEIVGANDKAEKKYMFGIDYLLLK